MFSIQQDAEKDKLRSALGSAIMVETPNIKVWALPCSSSQCSTTALHCSCQHWLLCQRLTL